MTKISIAFLAALSLAGFGCHKDKAKDKASAAVAKLTELKNKMCAELTDWDQAQGNAAGGKPVISEEDDKKIEEKIEDIKEETTQCLLKLEFPGRTGAEGSSGAAGTAGGSGGTGSGNPAGGAADGSAAGAAPAGGAAAGSAGGSAAPSAGSAH
jgi:hypothetical protein